MKSDSSYHHGDLRAALVKAAAAEIERSGYENLSLRELAESLGVSRAAPYRHFADRRALLAAVAADGFDGLRRSTAQQSRTERPRRFGSPRPAERIWHSRPSGRNCSG